MNRTTSLASMKKVFIDPKLFPLPRDPELQFCYGEATRLRSHACLLTQIPECQCY